MGDITKEVIAECVGLWLAEGGNKSKSEITFTNNCFPLVELFKRTMDEIFKGRVSNQRIYIYSSNGEKVKIPFEDCVVKYYIHKRATKPYFIFRIASVVLIKEWNDIVKDFLQKEENYSYILRGFFAGEGNIHEGKRGVRLIRISQKERKQFIDNLLDYFAIKYNFTSSNRMYNISNKRNWDTFAKYKLADLHPTKKEKFWRLYNGFKEEHYDKFYLRDRLFEILKEHSTSKDLAKNMNRSHARVSEVLVDLKKEGKIINYRVGSIDYWTNNNNLIIISKIKKEYLSFLTKERKTYEFAKHFNVDWKSSFRRLTELKKLNLVKMEENGIWKKTPTEKKIIVI